MDYQEFYGENVMVGHVYEFKVGAQIVWPNTRLAFNKFVSKMTKNGGPKVHDERYFDRQIDLFIEELKKENAIPKGSHMVEYFFQKEQLYDIFDPEGDLLLEEVDFKMFAAFTV